MFSLMLRDVASDGLAFADPNNPGTYSLPGCVLASPSHPQQVEETSEEILQNNYIYNWTRDAEYRVRREPLVRGAPGRCREA
jgi:glucoamylase